MTLKQKRQIDRPRESERTNNAHVPPTRTPAKTNTPAVYPPPRLTGYEAR
jgi:hypothetical protein